MTLGITELEQIQMILSKEKDQDTIQEADKILNQWKDDLNSIPTALEIIDQSKNDNLLILAASKLKYNLVGSDNLSNENKEVICNIIIGRIHKNRSEKNLKSNTLDYLIELIAFTIFLNPQLSELIKGKCNFLEEEQMQFLVHLLRYLSSDSKHTDLQSQLRNSYENDSIIFDLLRKGDEQNVTPTWVKLFSISSKYIYPITELEEFIPKVRIAMEDEKNIQSILDFYDYILEDQEENQFIKDFATILIEYAKTVFNDKPTITKVNYASHIWAQTIDGEYFDYFVDLGFTQYIFNSFIEFFQAFLSYDLEDDFNDFFVLLDAYTSRLGNIPEGASLESMADYITTGLDFIIECLDYVSDINLKENECLYPFCLYDSRMDSSLKQIMQTNSDSKEFNHFLSEYFKKKFDNLTNGVLYAFSFLPKMPRQIFSSSIVLAIFDMPEKLVSSIYFIATCCQFTEDLFKRKEIEITFAISQLDYIPKYKVANALAELSKCCAPLFIENGDEYIQQMLKMIDDVPVSEMNSILSELFIAVFNVLSNLQLNFLKSIQSSEEEQKPETQQTAQAIEEILNNAKSLFVDKVSQINQIDEFNDLILFCYFAKSVIENIENYNNESISKFHMTLFPVIEEGLNAMINNEGFGNFICQQLICEVILEALKQNWVEQRKPYFDWIEDTILTSPEDKLPLLTYLIDFLPSEQISAFFSNYENFDSKTMENSFCFLIEVINKRPDTLKTIVNLDQMLTPINRNMISLYTDELDLLITFMQKTFFDISAEDADKLAQLIAQKVFSLELKNPDNLNMKGYIPNTDISNILVKGVQLMRVIGFRFSILENTLKYIIESLNIKSQNISIFAQYYMNEKDVNLSENPLKILITEFIELCNNAE